MTERQQNKIREGKIRIKDLEKLLRRLKMDLNYLHKECYGTTPKTLITSRIKLINKVFNL